MNFTHINSNLGFKFEIKREKKRESKNIKKKERKMGKKNWAEFLARGPSIFAPTPARLNFSSWRR
jgi:hypothetical protein